MLNSTNKGHDISMVCILMILFTFFLTSCSSPGTNARTGSFKNGLASYLLHLPTVKTIDKWELPEFIIDRSTPGIIIHTAHYDIYTTLQDALILRQVPVFLESAFCAYSDTVGHKIKTDKKLVVYFFETRSQWEQFTHHWTGLYAEMYLKIKAGAYYANGACVVYHLARQTDFSILAHEGWHQFSDEIFQYRLPAWVDEGLATNFEAYSNNGKVKFTPQRNAGRLYSLRQTISSDQMIPLANLLTLDAGRVVSHADMNSQQPVRAYYAQLYAFIRFMREYKYGKYASRLNALLEHARMGRWPLSQADHDEAVRRGSSTSRSWNARVGKFIFQRYIAPYPEEIEAEYHAFCQKILANVRFKKAF